MWRRSAAHAPVLPLWPSGVLTNLGVFFHLLLDEARIASHVGNVEEFRVHVAQPAMRTGACVVSCAKMLRRICRDSRRVCACTIG